MSPMPHTTSRAQFDTLLDGHRVVPVIRELFADGETPVGIYRKLALGKPGSFLLESAEQGGIWSRFSFVGVSSFGVLTQDGEESVWIDYGVSRERALGDTAAAAPLDTLAALYARWQTPQLPNHPPLTGGLVGFIGWDAIRQLEKLPNRPPADYSVPGQAFTFVADLVVLDHAVGTVQLIAAVLNDGVQDADELWADAQTRLDALQSGLAQPAEAWIAEVDLSLAATPSHRTSREDFLGAVEKSKEYIRDGDIFQVVISQRFDQECTAEPLEVYRVLRTLNPSPYMYLLSLEDVNGQP